MTQLTCETRVGNHLILWLQKQPEIAIISYHPTSAKAYQTELIRIPKLTVDGKRTKERYHIDLIFISRQTLWLVELKCKLSESLDDIAKLLEIQQRYTTEQLRSIILSRLTAVEPEKLNTVSSLVLSLGVEIVDTPIPENFKVFQVTEKEVNLYE